MNEAWKEYAEDFNCMTDEEIEMEYNLAFAEIEEAESWIRAVISWEAAGKPRKDDQQ